MKATASLTLTAFASFASADFPRRYEGNPYAFADEELLGTSLGPWASRSRSWR